MLNPTRGLVGRTNQLWVARNCRRFTIGEEAAAKRAEKEKGNAPTVFERIARKEIPAKIVFEDSECVAFEDVAPQAPVHLLVVPKRKIPMLDDCQASDGKILAHLLLTAKSLGKQNSPSGYRIVINNGKDGAQSVYHLHVHVLGGRQMKWPPG